MTTRTRSPRGEGASLREDIVDAATQLLAETGDESSVSVRAIAARVGVSTPSLYLHFADRQAILDAVCERVWSSLDEAMEKAAAATSTAMDDLRCRGVAYVKFGLANPEHYRIVMMDRRTDERLPEGMVGAASGSGLAVATSAFAHLLESVQACIDDGTFGPGPDGPPDLIRLGLQLWAGAHGIASLVIAKPHFPWPPLDQLVEDMIAAVGIGLAAQQRLGGYDPTELGSRLDRLRD